jgi:hypothetical protein
VSDAVVAAATAPPGAFPGVVRLKGEALFHLGRGQQGT